MQERQINSQHKKNRRNTKKQSIFSSSNF